MSKINQALEVLAQGLKSKTTTMTQKRNFLILALGLSGIGALLLVSHLNNGLFMDRLLAISAIVSCILFVKTIGNS